MSNYQLKPPVIDLDTFAQDFANHMAEKHGRKTPTVTLTVVADDKWDQLLAIINPYRADRNNKDKRTGISLAVKERILSREVPDLLKTLFPQIAEALQNSNIVLILNQQALTHPQETSPEQAFNAVMTRLVVLVEKALMLLDYPNLNPITDSEDFHKSSHFNPAKYLIVSGQ